MSTLYVLTGCPICAAIQTYLHQQNIPFTVINILENQQGAVQLKQHLGEIYTPILIDQNTICKTPEDIINWAQNKNAPSQNERRRLHITTSNSF